MKTKRGAKATNSKKYQRDFNSSSRVRKRGGGIVAWVSGNSALSVISREGLELGVQSHIRKEKERKANITNF